MTDYRIIFNRQERCGVYRVDLNRKQEVLVGHLVLNNVKYSFKSGDGANLTLSCLNVSDQTGGTVFSFSGEQEEDFLRLLYP